jgi:hypothetical protein
VHIARVVVVLLSRRRPQAEGLLRLQGWREEVGRVAHVVEEQVVVVERCRRRLLLLVREGRPVVHHSLVVLLLLPASSCHASSVRERQALVVLLLHASRMLTAELPGHHPLLLLLHWADLIR